MGGGGGIQGPIFFFLGGGQGVIQSLHWEKCRILVIAKPSQQLLSKVKVHLEYPL